MNGVNHSLNMDARVHFLSPSQTMLTLPYECHSCFVRLLKERKIRAGQVETPFVHPSSLRSFFKGMKNKARGGCVDCRLNFYCFLWHKVERESIALCWSKA